MKKEKITKTKDINLDEIILLASEVARNSYGVVALYEEKSKDTKDNKKKGSKESGVHVHKHSDNTLTITVNLVLAYGIKITEALRECQKSIKFTLDKKYPSLCREVNVYALELR